MRILMLTQWFHPEPAFKGLPFAKELTKRGHSVEVLTGFPNYPGGKVYPGYRIVPWQSEEIDGVRVFRVALYPSHDRSSIRRAWNYLSFAVSASMLGPMLVRRPDVIYAYHPPGSIGIPALVLGRIFSAPVVYDVQDLWPDTIFATGMISHGIAGRIVTRLCRSVYTHVDHLAVLSPGFKATLIHRGVPAERIEVIYNWAPESPAAEGQKVARASDTKFKVLFAGTMGIAQGLDAVLDAASECAARTPEACFVFVGDGVDRERLERRSKDMGLTNVEFRPRQPMSAMPAVFDSVDALLVHLKDDPLFRITIPSKTQAYLAAGKPIIMGVRGDAADLVERAGAGVVCEPENPNSIAEAVRTLARAPQDLLAQMGRSGRAFYRKELAMDIGISRFNDLFEAVQRS